MSFYGSTFVFNNIPSEAYNLYITSPDGGPVDVPGSSNVELVTEKIFRRPTVYFYGAQQTPVLSFDVAFISPTELTAVDMQHIQAWLFGRMNYTKLQIMQEDMQDIYFNCFLTNPRISKIGNLIVGVKATVVCDSPWAWTFERTFHYTYSDNPVNTTLVQYNNGDNNQLLYPKMSILMNSTGGQVSITNQSTSKTFMFLGVAPNETITVDNYLQIISSSTGLNRMPYFNKNWLSLARGRNVFTVYGYIASLDFIFSEAKKIGG